MGIIISRTAAENALLNKHDIKRLVAEGKLIKGLPIVDSKNPQHIEEITGNETRVFKMYPAGFDFIVNFINGVWHKGEQQRSFVRMDKEWWKARINEKTWKEYFVQCGNHNIRRNLATMVMKDLSSGIIKITGKEKGRWYVDNVAPFRILKRREYEDGTGYRDIILNHAVFGSLITMDCKKTGNEGWIELPPTLYPLLTGPDTGLIKSYNPHYKLQLLGFKKNTHKKKSASVSRQEFLETVVPEYLDRHGNLEIPTDQLRKSIEGTLRAIVSKLPEGLIVKNYFLGSKGGNSIIYFRTDT